MNTKNVPVLIMLLAGLVACLVMIRSGVSNRTFLTTLLLVLICFYIAGFVVKYVLDKNFKEEEDSSDEEASRGEEGDKEDISTDEDDTIPPSEENPEEQEAKSTEENQ